MLVEIVIYEDHFQLGLKDYMQMIVFTYLSYLSSTQHLKMPCSLLKIKDLKILKEKDFSRILKSPLKDLVKILQSFKIFTQGSLLKYL